MLAVFALTAQPASAHPEIRTANPAEGSILPEAPDEAVLRFDMELNPDLSSMQVAGPDGDVIAEGEVDLDDPDRSSMVADLPDDLPNGEYTVSWTVAEAGEDEAHEGDSQLTFTIDPSAPPVASATVVIAAPEGTIEPVDEDAQVDTDDDGGIGRGPLIVGGLAVVVALAVMATINRRRGMR